MKFFVGAVPSTSIPSMGEANNIAINGSLFTDERKADEVIKLWLANKAYMQYVIVKARLTTIWQPPAIPGHVQINPDTITPSESAK